MAHEPRERLDLRSWLGVIMLLVTLGLFVISVMTLTQLAPAPEPLAWHGGTP